MLIRVIDPLWEGPRHDRLRACWDRVRAATAHEIEFVANRDGVNHQTMLERCYRGSDPDQSLIITEMDFLPDIADDWVERVENRMRPGRALGVQYQMRDPETFLLDGPRNIPGGWFMAFKRDRPDADDLDFGGTDPANNLDCFGSYDLLSGTDDFPGQTYRGIGHHLFWSRHYNDPDHAVHAGFPMSLVLPLTDKHITRWEKHGRI